MVYVDFSNVIAKGKTFDDISTFFIQCLLIKPKS